MNRRTLIASGVGLLALAACGNDTTSAGPASSGPGSDHNSQDAMFAQMMIVHHEGAVEMSALAEKQAETADVKALATRIKKAQTPEIQQMKDWLKAWGEPTDMPHKNHDMPGMDMHGMSQQLVMAKLRGLKGKEFDKQFLTSMIAHHEGALEMAKTEKDRGRNAEALKLADTIITSQKAEIDEMKGMLAKL